MGSDMEEEKVCNCEDKHQGHLCVLRGKGLTCEIRRRTGAPNVACLTCGEEADSEDSVCSPIPLFT
jgi:hypothetical protein